jgi:formamidopyrimidine-DNA glycosylase
MPEMPEVEGLARFLAGRTSGLAFERVRVLSPAALRTYDPPAEALEGAVIRAVGRRGKHVVISADRGGSPIHLVFHLAKAGWLRWSDALSPAPVKPGGYIAARIRLDDGSGFDLTEAGTRKSLAIHVVRSPEDVPGIATLGPEPLDEGFTLERFAAILAGRRARIKGLLRDQKVIAGIGNAYSDEILHVARMSPYALGGSLTPEAVDRLYAAMRSTLESAVAAASARPPAELKDAKRSGMRVHGRDGLPCPVCGDTVRSVIFSDSTFQYCPTCQTGGKPLADRVLSRLLK